MYKIYDYKKVENVPDTDNSMAEQPEVMTYEKAYKKAYETFVLWLVGFKNMKPDENFSQDRINGSMEALASMIVEMEDYKPEIKILREELETWGNDIREE